MSITQNLTDKMTPVESEDPSPIPNSITPVLKPIPDSVPEQDEEPQPSPAPNTSVDSLPESDTETEDTTDSNVTEIAQTASPGGEPEQPVTPKVDPTTEAIPAPTPEPTVESTAAPVPEQSSAPSPEVTPEPSTEPVPEPSVDPIPEQSSTPETQKDFTYYSVTVCGITVKVLEFDPQDYTASMVLAHDKLYCDEAAADIVKRNNGYLAVNGAFFNSYSDGDLTIHASMVHNGEVLRIDSAYNPYRPAFVIDTMGNASIEFLKINQIVTLIKDGKAVDQLAYVGKNVAMSETDGARMICTRIFGDVVTGTIAKAVVADENGIILAVYKEPTTNILIPETGFVLFERKIRHQWETFFDVCEVGDQLDVSVVYEGSSTQEIAVLLSCGPTLVKNNGAYAAANTFEQEGFFDPKVTSYSAVRMAIGVKADGTVVIASTTAKITTMGQIMAELNCETAMNLDGGASSALYADGWEISAGRKLSNMLIFTKK